MKKGIIILLILIGFVTPYSCEDMTLIVDCHNCFSEKPTITTITIKVTKNDENAFVPIIIYRGDIETGEIIKKDTAFFNTYEVVLNIDEYYSVQAEYQNKGKTIYAVDGKKLRTRKDNSSCDEPCYIILGDELDVRLK